MLNPDEAVVWILEEGLRPCLTQNDYGGSVTGIQSN
jgi:hypothetical protein